MRVLCHYGCGRYFNDENNSTLCPHAPLGAPADTTYCRTHDLFNCPHCTDSKTDLLGICQPLEKRDRGDQVSNFTKAYGTQPKDENESLS